MPRQLKKKLSQPRPQPQLKKKQMRQLKKLKKQPKLRPHLKQLKPRQLRKPRKQPPQPRPQRKLQQQF